MLSSDIGIAMENTLRLIALLHSVKKHHVNDYTNTWLMITVGAADAHVTPAAKVRNVRIPSLVVLKGFVCI